DRNGRPDEVRLPALGGRGQHDAGHSLDAAHAATHAGRRGDRPGRNGAGGRGVPGVAAVVVIGAGPVDVAGAAVPVAVARPAAGDSGHEPAAVFAVYTVCAAR